MNTFIPYLDFSSFRSIVVVTIAAAGLGVVWMARTSSAWIGLRILVPIVVVALAIVTPVIAPTIMGYPVPATMADLPEVSRLIAFEMKGNTMADVWIGSDDGKPPRVFEIPVPDDKSKDALKQAKKKIKDDQPVYLKVKKKPKQGKEGKDGKEGQKSLGGPDNEVDVGFELVSPPAAPPKTNAD